MNNDKEAQAKYRAYWELINAINDLCSEAIECGKLYSEDAISALDRVKLEIFRKHLEIRYDLKERDDINNDFTFN